MKKNTFQKIALLHMCTLAVTSSYGAIPSSLDKPFRWYYSVTGMYLRPMDTGQYATLADEVYNTKPLRTHASPQISLGIGYFLNPTDDVSFQYDHADTLTSNTSKQTEQMNDSISGFNYVKVKFDNEYNSLNLRLGRWYTNDGFITHLFTGLDLTNHSNHFNLYGTPFVLDSTDPVNATPRNTNTDWKLYGFGPQIGINSSYHINDHISLVGGGDLSLLVSRVSYKFISEGASREYTESSDSYNGMALKLQANVGASYDTVIASKYLLSIELGYKVLFLQSHTSAPDGGEGVRTIGSGNHNFSMSGPYLGFKLSI